MLGFSVKLSKGEFFILVKILQVNEVNEQVPPKGGGFVKKSNF